MAGLVGDCLISARELIADLPQVVTAPTNAMTYTNPVTAGATIPAATYYIRHTLATPWGETVITTGTETTLGVSSGQAIQVALPAGFVFPTGVSSLRVYTGLSPSTYNQYIDLPVTSTFPVAITSFTSSLTTTLAVGAIPPTINRAYLPDTDGNFVGAGAMYRWLNEGLDRASDITGGIRDYTGVGTTVGQPMYQLTGQWMKFMTIFYDGYIVTPAGLGRFFLRNATQGYVGIELVVTLTPNTIMEVFPQPIRTTGTLQLNAQLSFNGTSIAVTNINNFVLPFGLALIGGSEIVYYQSTSGNVMSGLTRGLGGTIPQTWPINTNVTELNIRILGLRRATKYTIGNSLTSMRIPPGWETLLPIYMQSKYYEVERGFKEASQYRQQFEKELQQYKQATKDTSGPNQIDPERGYNETYGGGLGGGFLIR